MEYNRKTLEKALKEDKVVEWSVGFFEGPGRNKKIATGLRKHEYKKVQLKDCRFRELYQIAGPHPKYLFSKDPKVWNRIVTKMENDIKEGWEPLPLFVKVDRENNRLLLGDGNHRLEALKRLGHTHYECLLFEKKTETKKKEKPNQTAKSKEKYIAHFDS